MCVMSSAVPSLGSISATVRRRDYDYAFYGNNTKNFPQGEYMQLVLQTARPIGIADILDTQYSTEFLEELADAVLPKPVSRGGGMRSFGSFSTLGAVEAGIVGNWAVVCGPASQVADSIRLFAGEQFREAGVRVPRVNTRQVRVLGIEGVSAVIAVPLPGTRETGYKPFGFRYEPVSQDWIDVVGSLESHDGGIPRWGESVDRALRFVVGSDEIQNGVRPDYLSDTSPEIDEILNVPFVGIRFKSGQNGTIRVKYDDVVNASGSRGNWNIPYELAPQSDYIVS